MSRNLRLVYDYERIMEEINSLAGKLYLGLGGKTGAAEGLTFLVLLKGGARFAFDLMTRYPGRYYYEFAGVSSYADNTYSRGVVEFYHFAPRREMLDGRVVVLLDDICDSGLTFDTLSKRLEREFQPRAIRTCALIRREGSSFLPDFFAFSATGEDYFVGYGLGMGEEYRHLNGIYSLIVG